MPELPLHFLNNHLFIELESDRWLLDTGAPQSFGDTPLLTVADQQFDIASGFMGLTAQTLSELVGIPCAGLLGADVLGRFDHLIDVAGGTLTISSVDLACDGHRLQLESCLGVPIVTARIADTEHRMFFDTGAKLSYVPSDMVSGVPSAGRVRDFYPGFGSFETETYLMDIDLDGLEVNLRCGVLPPALAASLVIGGTTGIVGNAILADRTVGYFPRRSILVL